MDALKMGLEASANVAKEVAKACKNGILNGKRFNFNSQICTTREQAERLLALGLKKETADMAYLWYGRAEDDSPLLMDKPSLVYQGIMTTHDLPAWSLQRLIEMALRDIYICGISFVYGEDAYEKVIRIIEHQIASELFPKQFLSTYGKDI